MNLFYVQAQMGTQSLRSRFKNDGKRPGTITCDALNARNEAKRPGNAAFVYRLCSVSPCRMSTTSQTIACTENNKLVVFFVVLYSFCALQRLMAYISPLLTHPQMKQTLPCFTLTCRHWTKRGFPTKHFTYR